MSQPIVSVILPVYNGENYLRRAVESVLAQSLRDIELIIVDDGSSDGTADIARQYVPRAVYVRQQNTGVAGAFNHGLRLATGRYISWLSHDDVYLPEKLQRQAAALDRVGGPAACYTDVQFIDGEGAVMTSVRLPEHDRQRLLRHLVTGGKVCSACYSLMYDRACIGEVGDYAKDWRYTQDVEMLLRLSRRFPLIHLPEALVQVRDHDERGIGSRGWREEVERFFRHQLHTIPLVELFPEAPEPSVAYCWLGDALAKAPYPIYRLAYGQYRRALKAGRSRRARLLWRFAALGMREVYALLVRLAWTLPPVRAALRRIYWRLATLRPRPKSGGSRDGYVE